MAVKWCSEIPVHGGPLQPRLLPILQKQVHIRLSSTHRHARTSPARESRGRARLISKLCWSLWQKASALSVLDQKRAPDFKNAIRNGEGFTVDIRHDSLPRFDSEDFDERQFLSVLINVLHLLISRHDIGLDYAAILCDRIRCGENKLQQLTPRIQYLVSVLSPTTHQVCLQVCIAWWFWNTSRGCLHSERPVGSSAERTPTRIQPNWQYHQLLPSRTHRLCFSSELFHNWIADKLDC